MQFNTTYNRQYKSPPEKNAGGSLIEKAGYVSAQKRIENLMLAGQRLSDYRKEQFDFEDGKIDEDAYDPTRRKDFDMADAFQMSQNLNKSIRARTESLKASQTAPEAPEGAPDNKNVPE